jgi:hypothetical protein
MKAALSVLFFAALVGAEEVPRRIELADGQVFDGAVIKELRPKGAAIESEMGIAIVPMEKLPADLRKRYGDDGEVQRLTGGKIDGVYGPVARPGSAVMAGSILTLENGRFSRQGFSDVGDGRAAPPITGSFTKSGLWVTFDHREMHPMMLAVIDGKLALIYPQEFKRWRDDGRKPEMLHIRENP